MQGVTYSFPSRANPFLTNEEDPNMRLWPEAASWFGKKCFRTQIKLFLKIIQATYLIKIIYDFLDVRAWMVLNHIQAVFNFKNILEKQTEMWNGIVI